jgi:hypothetical protein
MRLTEETAKRLKNNLRQQTQIKKRGGQIVAPYSLI